MSGQCIIDDCEKPHYGKGLCRNHYMRMYRNGSPLASKSRTPAKGGIRKHPLYAAWAGMVNRCHNPNNASFPRYGARGIAVCDRWRDDFRHFLADMGERPDGMTLDRVDPYGGYAPDNCRWATPAEQRANITAEGDARMREAARASKIAFWERRRNL